MLRQQMNLKKTHLLIPSEHSYKILQKNDDRDRPFNVIPLSNSWPMVKGLIWGHPSQLGYTLEL